MSILNELFPARFKGAEFLVTSASTTGGRKTTTHEFVNSDNRNVEDLGKQLKSFTVSGIVTEPNYFQKRNRLTAALEQKGRGVLEHPFFGRVEVVAKPYTISENLNSLGEARFEMVFEKADDVVLPQAGLSVLSQIANLVGAANQLIADSVGNTFNVSNSFVSSYGKAEALLGSIAAIFNAVTGVFAPGDESVAEFNSLLESYNDSTAELIDDPVELGADTLELFSQIAIISQDDPVQCVNIFRDFFDFNSDSENIGVVDPRDNSISVEQAEILSNEQILTLQMRATSLAFAYLCASLTEFSNIDELEVVQQTLEEQYQVIYEDQTTPVDILISLQDLRDGTEKFFEQQKLTINDITELQIKSMPAQVLTYALYGSLDQSQDIINLNNDPDVSFYRGTVKVLTG